MKNVHRITCVPKQDQWAKGEETSQNAALQGKSEDHEGMKRQEKTIVEEKEMRRLVSH